MENAIEHVPHDAWNKGVIVGQKVTVQTEGDLGNSGPTSTSAQNS